MTNEEYGSFYKSLCGSQSTALGLLSIKRRVGWLTLRLAEFFAQEQRLGGPFGREALQCPRAKQDRPRYLGASEPLGL